MKSRKSHSEELHSERNTKYKQALRRTTIICGAGKYERTATTTTTTTTTTAAAGQRLFYWGQRSI